MKILEKMLFSFLLVLTLFCVLFFAFPKQAEGGIMICGVTYPPYPPDWHSFEYKSNCCVVIPNPI